MRWQRWAGLTLVAVCMGSPAAAQQITAAKVVFKDPGPFAQADLESVAGVHAGQKLALKDIQAAAQHLADTGCFDDVHVDSAGPANALTLIFLLKPNVSGDLHPVVFENLVWLSPEELQAAVHTSVPLFAGSSKLPETTAVLDAVSTGLQQALAAKGLAGAEVSHEVVLASSEMPVTTVRFRVARPMIRINEVTLDGVSPQMALTVAGAAGKLHNAPYLNGPAAGSIDSLLLKPYRDAGYLDARLAEQKLTVAPMNGKGVVPVNVEAVVESGAAYQVSAVRFEGTSVVPEQTFAGAAKLHAGEVASRSALLASEATIDDAYHKLGYMDAYVDAGAMRNPTAHTVSYTLKVVPGNSYRLHAASVQGLPAEARAQFEMAWAMKPGDPYNADYVRSFLTNNTAMQRLTNYVGSFQAAADPSTHLVDLTLTFQPTTGAIAR